MKQPGGWDKTAFLYAMMARLGYDAVTLGDGDLRQGADSLQALFARYPQVQVVSANVRDKSGGLRVPEYAVIEKDGIRFGVTGTLAPEYYRFNLEAKLQPRDEFLVGDSRAALLRVVPRLRKECDVVVVLLHESVDSAMAFAATIPGIDIAVAGHDPGINPAPESMNGPLLVRPGNRGQYVYRVPLVLDRSTRRIAGYGGQPRMLDKALAREAQMDYDVARFDQDWKAKYRPTATLPGK